MGIYGHTWDKYRVDLHPELVTEGGGGKLSSLMSKIMNWEDNFLKNHKNNNEVSKNKAEENKWNSLSEEEKKEIKELIRKKADEFERLAKSELRKLMNDQEFRKKIRSQIDKAFEDGDLDPKYNRNLYKNDKLPKTTVEDEGGGYLIIDDEQEVNVVCGDICSELAKRLEKITGYQITTGDGDEGCIYPEELLDYNRFYNNVYKKNKE